MTAAGASHSEDILDAASPPRILFVEDDRRLSAFLQRYFTEQGYAASSAHDGPQMRAALDRDRYDMVVLDINLPGREDGYALARELRRQDGLGILFLSARQEPVDRIVGLEIGADDFVVKPFEPRELLARIRAVLRRLPAGAGGPARSLPPPDQGRAPQKDGAPLSFGQWRLDLASRQLLDAENRVRSLTTQEFNLLSVLAQRPGRILSRDQLMDLTVNRAWSPYDRSVDVMIGRIRRKIGDQGPDYRRIRTIRGIGYMFSPEP